MPYVANDAFCTLAQVSDRAQRGTYTASSIPTDQQVLDAMARRAVQIEGIIRKYGLTYTVPSRSNPFPAYGAGNNEADRLRVMCEDANAIGAALDAVQMQDAQAKSTSQDLIQALMKLYEANLILLEDYAKKVAGTPAPVSVNQAVSTDTADQNWDLDTQW